MAGRDAPGFVALHRSTTTAPGFSEFQYDTFGGREKVAVWAQPQPQPQPQGGPAGAGGTGALWSSRERRREAAGAVRVCALFSVRVVGHETRHPESGWEGEYTAYLLEVQTSYSTTVVARRYRQFHSLKQDLVAAYADGYEDDLRLPKFPPKVWFSSMDAAVIAHRAESLGAFLSAAVAHPVLGAGPEMRQFLGLVPAWREAVAACRRALNPVTARVLVQAGETLQLPASEPAMEMLKRRLAAWGAGASPSVAVPSAARGSTTPRGRRSRWFTGGTGSRADRLSTGQLGKRTDGAQAGDAAALGTTAPAAGLLVPPVRRSTAGTGTLGTPLRQIGADGDSVAGGDGFTTPRERAGESKAPRSTGGRSSSTRLTKRSEVAALTSTFANTFTELTGDTLDAAAMMDVAQSLRADFVGRPSTGGAPSPSVSRSSTEGDRSADGADADETDGGAETSSAAVAVPAVPRGELQRAWSTSEAPLTAVAVEEPAAAPVDIGRPPLPTIVSGSSPALAGSTGASPASDLVLGPGMGAVDDAPMHPGVASSRAAELDRHRASSASSSNALSVGSYDDVFDQFTAASPDTGLPVTAPSSSILGSSPRHAYRGIKPRYSGVLLPTVSGASSTALSASPDGVYTDHDGGSSYTSMGSSLTGSSLGASTYGRRRSSGPLPLHGSAGVEELLPLSPANMPRSLRA